MGATTKTLTKMQSISRRNSHSRDTPCIVEIHPANVVLDWSKKSCVSWSEGRLQRILLQRFVCHNCDEVRFVRLYLCWCHFCCRLTLLKEIHRNSNSYLHIVCRLTGQESKDPTHVAWSMKINEVSVVRSLLFCSSHPSLVEPGIKSDFWNKWHVQ